MQPLTLVIGIVLAALSGIGRVQAGDDLIVEPGVRVGVITAHATAATLQRLLPGKVRNAPIHVGEGEMVAGAMIYPDDPTRRLELTWTDGTKRSGVDQIKVIGTGWATPRGLRIGMRLRALNRLNGKPFRLFGFAFDGEGIVSSWRGGKLNGLEETLTVRLSVDPKAYRRAAKKHGRTDGDGAFSSGHPTLVGSNPAIGELVVKLSAAVVGALKPKEILRIVLANISAPIRSSAACAESTVGAALHLGLAWMLSDSDHPAAYLTASCEPLAAKPHHQRCRLAMGINRGEAVGRVTIRFLYNEHKKRPIKGSFGCLSVP